MADLNAVGKNNIENSLETNDEAFLSLVQNIIKLMIADASNSRKDNGLYIAYENYAKTRVIDVLNQETRAEKWKIEKVLSERALTPADRDLAVVKKIGETEPYSVIGPLALEML
jgi:hypothetical protein